jgi:hypothetical protein
MMVSTYCRLLAEIKRRPARVFDGPIRLGRIAKWGLAARWFLLPPRRSALP